MNKILAAKWARALESGRYKQTDGILVNDLEVDEDTLVIKKTKNTPSYCCLGVLCRVAEKMPEFKKYIPDIRTALMENEVNLSFLVKNNKGQTLTFNRVVGMKTEVEEKFISMNDDEKADFKTIAKEVRRRYKV